MIQLRLLKRMPDFDLDVSLELDARVSGLFGPSGTGKSTVLDCIAGLRRADEGRICLNDRVLWDSAAGTDVATEERGLGYVFQKSRLFPHLTARKNLLYGLRARSLALDTRRFAAVVELLGIAPLLERYPRTLSVGEQQRVAIGRAVLSKPQLLLMDEPLAALDAARRADILVYVRRLRDELDLAMIYVSHAPDEIAAIAEQVALIQSGRILAVGHPAEMLLLGGGVLGELADSSILRARVRECVPVTGTTVLDHAGGALIVPQLALAPGSMVALRIHARDVVLGTHLPEGLSIRNALRGTVGAIAALDRTSARVEVRVGDDLLHSTVTHEAVRDLALEKGKPVFALIKSTAIELALTDRGRELDLEASANAAAAEQVDDGEKNDRAEQ